MKRAIALLVLLAAAPAYAQPYPEEELDQLQLNENKVLAARDVPLVIPPEYGKLVSVAVDSEVHYLYFQDTAGAIRIVAIGPRSAAQKARQVLQLLVPDVHVIERVALSGQGEVSPPPPRRMRR